MHSSGVRLHTFFSSATSPGRSFRFPYRGGCFHYFVVVVDIFILLVYKFEDSHEKKSKNKKFYLKDFK